MAPPIWKERQTVDEGKFMDHIIKIVDTVARVDQKTDNIGDQVEAVDKKLDSVKDSIDEKFAVYDQFVIDTSKDSGKNKSFRTGVTTILVFIGTVMVTIVTYLLTNGNVFGG